MYQNIFVNRKDSKVYLWDDEKGMLVFPFRPYAYRKKKGGLYKSINGESLEKIYNFNPRDPSLFESDVPIETRILIDAYEDSDEPSKGHVIATIDIEVSTEGGFPNVQDGDKEITAIALHDSATNKYKVFILDKERKIADQEKDDVEIISFDNEESLLNRFFNTWEEIRPTIVTGWNIDGFDMVYLYNRAKHVVGDKIAKKLSPIGVCYYNKYAERMNIAGVSCLDYLPLYKKYIGRTEPNYTLGEVGKRVVGIGKVTYKGSLNDLYKADLQRYIEYNLNDVKIVVALDKKLQFIELVRNICHTGHVPYENFAIPSKYLEGSILVYLRRQGKVAPNKPMDGKEEYAQRVEDDEEGFEGAFVKEPVPGRYDWVYDLDLTSMYPNIIISLNISPETKVAMVSKIEYDECWLQERKDELSEDYNNLSDSTQESITLDEYVDERLFKFNVRMFAQNKVLKYHVGSAVYSHEDFVNMIRNGNFSIASNGAVYKKPESENETGTIPSILIKWFDERAKMRKMAKKFADEKNWEQYEFYDSRQKVQKILLNSIYGCLGLPVFRFYDKDNAEAVTLTGVDIIKTAGKAINSYYRKRLNMDGEYVIYTDTDSCFASALPIIKHTMPDLDNNDEKQMTEAILAVCGEVQKFVNTMFDTMADKFFNVQKHRFHAKQEVIAKTSFWLKKKRYAQFIINVAGIDVRTMEVTHENKSEFVLNENNEPIAKLEIKGIDVVRTNFPFKFRSFMQGFLVDILKKTDKSTIDTNLLYFKDNMKNYSVIDVAKNTSVKFVSRDGKKNYNPDKRQPFQMVQGAPAQVKAALWYNDLLQQFGLSRQIPEIFHGQKIKWVYLKNNEYGIECLAFKADGTDPDEILQFIDKYIDRNALYEQELQGKLVKYYEVLNWNFPNEGDSIVSEFFG